MKTKRRILIAGDLHGCFSALQAAIELYSPLMVLQCGDFGYWPGRGTALPKAGFQNSFGKTVPVYFCDGNHEEHPQLVRLRQAGPGPQEIVKGVFYQPRGSLLTLPDGRSVLFAGGARSIDRELLVKGEDWFPEEELTDKELQTDFPKGVTVDIVISHTAPALVTLPGSMDSEFYDPSRQVLDKIFHIYRPTRWFCGHFHKYFTQTMDSCILTALDCIPYRVYKSRAPANYLAFLDQCRVTRHWSQP